MSTWPRKTSRVHIGPHFGYNFKIEHPNIGVQASFPVARRVEFYPSFDWYLVGEGASVFGLNGDLSTDTRAGGNLFLGAESLRGRIHPFAEARVTLRRGTMFQLQGGLNITL